MQIKKSFNRGAKTVGLLLLALFLLLVAIAVAGVIWYELAISPVSKDKCSSIECDMVEFTVEQNSYGAEIASRLEEKGLIRSALAFRIYLSFEAENKTMQVGTYDFMPSMSVAEIVRMLNEGSLEPTFQITFLPGDTLSGVRARLKEKGYSDEEIISALNKQYDHELVATKPKDASYEGYIYGETYEFFADASVEDIILRTFDQFWQVVEEEQLVAKFEAQGLTLHEGIVLASVVQRESSTLPDDMPKVARIFYNRLRSNIPLGSDAIIAYYADQQNPSRDKTDMSYLTSTPCPWNSRACEGLPPTAISSPGVGALRAVANPCDVSDNEFNVNDIYFLTGDDQKMYYGATEVEHEQNIRKHCQVLCGIL